MQLSLKPATKFLEMQPFPFKKRVKFFVISAIFNTMIFFIGITCRKKIIGGENLEKLRDENKNWIYASWHDMVSIGSWVLRNQNLAIMVSNSSDGEIATRAIERMGNKTVRGSTSKGAVKAFIEMLKWIKQGNNAAITPDGPRGPRYGLQSGAITLAQKTGNALIPFHVGATRKWIFHKSWDKHMLPKPFSTMVISYGEPFYVPGKLSKDEFETVRVEFEALMIKNTVVVEENTRPS